MVPPALQTTSNTQLRAFVVAPNRGAFIIEEMKKSTLILFIAILFVLLVGICVYLFFIQNGFSKTPWEAPTEQPPNEQVEKGKKVIAPLEWGGEYIGQ